MALDIFVVRPPADLIYEAEQWRKTADHLALALEDRLDPAALLPDMTNSSRRSAFNTGRPHRIVIDNTTSEFFTIIEVFCHDRPGLLFYITDTLFHHGLDVRVAKIGTKIDQAVDVFYVRDSLGRKLVDSSRIEVLRTAIDKVLSGRSPPGRTAG